MIVSIFTVRDRTYILTENGTLYWLDTHGSNAAWEWTFTEVADVGLL